jgi:hypothetical protein
VCGGVRAGRDPAGHPGPRRPAAQPPDRRRFYRDTCVDETAKDYGPTNATRYCGWMINCGFPLNKGLRDTGNCSLYTDFWAANGGKVPDDARQAVCRNATIKADCPDYALFKEARVGASVPRVWRQCLGRGLPRAGAEPCLRRRGWVRGCLGCGFLGRGGLPRAWLPGLCPLYEGAGGRAGVGVAGWLLPLCPLQRGGWGVPVVFLVSNCLQLFLARRGLGKVCQDHIAFAFN